MILVVAQGSVIKPKGLQPKRKDFNSAVNTKIWLHKVPVDEKFNMKISTAKANVITYTEKVIQSAAKFQILNSWDATITSKLSLE